MKYTIAVVCLTAVLPAWSQDRDLYISTYSGIAMEEMRRTGIPASIKLAQAILESNAGSSELALQANNHFGIKCGGDWRGRQYMKKDDDRNARGKLVKSCFRVFRSPEESFLAHSAFLMDPAKKHRYGFLFDLDPTDYAAWARGLKRAGYATNPRYPQLLIKIIEDHALHRFDVLSTGMLADTETSSPQERTARRTSGEPDRPRASAVARRSYVIQYQNKRQFALAREGDTPESLARDLGIPVKRLEQANEHISHGYQPLTAGERIYLQRKRGKYKGNQKYHVVSEGQTLLQIAQAYGMRLNALQRLNGIDDGYEPVPGARLSLQKKNQDPVMTVPAGQTTPVHVSTQPGHPVLLEPITPKEEGAVERPATVAHAPDTSADHTKQVVSDQPGTETAGVINPAEVLELTYIVQPRDTLYGIARDHGLTVAQIKKLNNLTHDTIHPGQRLKLGG
ncbi:MAG: LysM peptidoglycan-binding domain-containing protein [Saprospiraceae bacterium]|nr:LysM peptidoglycan-binding domain-containing protein [Saprospiraceae bacterium]